MNVLLGLSCHARVKLDELREVQSIEYLRENDKPHT